MRATGKLFLVSAVAALAGSMPALAQQKFDTADAAAQAIINAAEKHDTAQLSAILGPKSGAILTSGKPNQDMQEQSEFARLAHDRMRIEVSAMNPNRAILAIGEEDWPFPVPICRTNGKWSFDPSQTDVEMRARHIGANELDAIEICHGYVDAQDEYAAEDRDHDGMLEYATHLMSAPGQQNGLYWAGASQPLVPKGFALAAWNGATKGDAKAYHGYYFRVLDGQGPDAPGGAHNYLVKGKMIGGFGLVAWPAEYGVSGIHTFIVNQDGIVFQKDIEPVAGKPSTPITRFDPDASWERVE